MGRDDGLPPVALMSRSLMSHELDDLQIFGKDFVEEQSTDGIKIARKAAAERESADSKVACPRRRKKKHHCRSSYHSLTQRIVHRKSSPPKKNTSDIFKQSQVLSCHEPNVNCSLMIQPSSQEGQNYPAFSFQNTSFSSTVANVKKRKKLQREFKNLVSGKTAVVDDKRNLRPRCPPKLNKETLLKHLREVKVCDEDGERLAGRRIKVYWPLDEKWYYGTVLCYDGPRKLHKIMYDDNQEEWLALRKERFKLQVSPGEVFGQTSSVAQETKPIYGKKHSGTFREKTSRWVKDIAQGNEQGDAIVNASKKRQLRKQRTFTHDTNGCVSYPASFETSTQNPQRRDISKRNTRRNDSEIEPKIGSPNTIRVYFRRRKNVPASSRFVKLHKDANFHKECSCASNFELDKPAIMVIHNKQKAIDFTLLMDSDRCRVQNEDDPISQIHDSNLILAGPQEHCEMEPCKTCDHRVMEGSTDTIMFPLASSLTQQSEELKSLSPQETEEQTTSNNADVSNNLDPSSRLLESHLPTHLETSSARKCLALTRVKESRESLTTIVQPAIGVIMSASNLKKSFRFLVNILNAENMAHNSILGRLFPMLNSMGISISVYDLTGLIRELLVVTLEKKMRLFDWCICRQTTCVNNKLYLKKVNGGCSETKHCIFGPTGINHMTFQQIVDIYVCSLFKPSIWASLSHSSTVTTASLQDFLIYDKGGHLEVSSQCQRHPVLSIALDSGFLRHLIESSPQQWKLLENGSAHGNSFLNCGSKQIVPVLRQFEAKTLKPIMTDQTHRHRLPHPSEVSEFAESSYSNDNKHIYAGIHAAVNPEKFSEEETSTLFGSNSMWSQADIDFGRVLLVRELIQEGCHLTWEEGFQIVAREIKLKSSKVADDDPDFSAGSKSERRCIPFLLDKGVKTDKGGKRSFSQCIESESRNYHMAETCDVKRFKGVSTGDMIPVKQKFGFTRKSLVQMEFEDKSFELSNHQKHSRSNISGLPSVQPFTGSTESKVPLNSVINVANISLANSIQSQKDWIEIDVRLHDSCRSSFSRMEEKVLPEIFKQYDTFQLPVNISSYLTLHENAIENGNQMNQRTSFETGKEWLQQKVAPISKVGWRKQRRDTFNSVKRHKPGGTLVSMDGSLQPQLSGRRGRPKKQKMLSEELPSFCTANLLIIDYDRCWREMGATVELYLSNGAEWVISTKAPGGLLYTHKVQPGPPTGTTNRFTHAMMWKGGNNWTLEFSDRRQWSNFKRIYEECCQRNARTSFLKHIPVPGVREIHDSSMDVECPNFARPPMKYINEIMGDIEAALVISHIVYDIDSEDECWIRSANNDRTIVDTTDSNSKSQISEDIFERIIDRLEKVSFKRKHEPISSDLAVDICEDLGSVDIVKVIHAYWLSKRQAKGMALVRHFQPAPWEIYEKQLQDWQACNNQSQLPLPPVGTSLLREVRIGPPLFAFCLRPRMLKIVNKNKMQKQKSQKKLSSGYGFSQCGASPSGSSCERACGEAVTDYSSSKEFVNNLGDAEFFSGVSTIPLNKQPVNFEPCSPISNASIQKYRTKKMRRKVRNTGVTSNEPQRIQQMQGMLGSSQQLSMNSNWQVKPESRVLSFFRSHGAGTKMVQNEANGKLRVSHTTIPRPSLDPFTNACQIQAKATLARLAATRKREEAQKMLLKFDLALKKVIATVIELEAIQIAGDSIRAASLFSSTNNTQIGSIQKVGLLCNDHASACKEREEANSGRGSLSVPNGDFRKYSEESISSVSGNNFQYSSDMRHMDSDTSLLPVASWSRELDAGLGTVLIQNTDKDQGKR